VTGEADRKGLERNSELLGDKGGYRRRINAA
jgi:hypothetical protein